MAATTIENAITLPELREYHRRHASEGHTFGGYALAFAPGADNSLTMTATDALGNAYTTTLTPAQTPAGA